MSIAKKKEVWLMKPSPGAHKTNDSIALAIVLRDMFGLAARSKEAIKLCKDGRVKVDGRVVKDPRFPIGFMDVVELPEISITYYMDLDGLGRLTPKREGRNFKLLKVMGKTALRGGKQQLSLSDGRTLVSAEKCKVGDTLKMSIPEFKVVGQFPLKAGAKCVILSGKNAGTHCTLQSITPGTVGARAMASVKTDAGEEIKTVLHYMYAIG